MQWIPTFTFFLFLYFLGWLISLIFYLFNQNLSSNNLSIIGTTITFILFIILLPSWGKNRWKANNLWVRIGLNVGRKYKAFKLFFNGFIWAFSLLSIFFLFLFLCGWVDQINQIDIHYLFDVIILIMGIVFAEELIFRGWLMEEMILLFGHKKGIFFQAAIFSISHIRFDIGWFSLIPFLLGLFLFGLVLTIRRNIDKGSLWGCIGLHGGLVGLWYLFDSGLVDFSSDTPFYFLGPSREMNNPIGSVIGIILLLTIVYFQRRVFSRIGRF